MEEGTFLFLGRFLFSWRRFVVSVRRPKEEGNLGGAEGDPRRQQDYNIMRLGAQ